MRATDYFHQLISESQLTSTSEEGALTAVIGNIINFFQLLTGVKP